MICAALFLPIDPSFVLSFAILGMIAGFSRLPLGWHTPQQVIAGWIYGLSATSLLLMVFMFLR